MDDSDSNNIEMKSPKTRKKSILEHGEFILNQSLSERRKNYLCKNDYTALQEILTWPDFFLKHNSEIEKLLLRRKKSDNLLSKNYTLNTNINSKISIWEGDITKLEIDSIVNAANSSLLGGGGVDGAIHRAAGSALLAQCRLLNGCKTGEAKTTYGFNLPAKYVIHTVGPMDGNSKALEKCYTSCLREFDKKNLKSIAFCCISTGIYGFPNDEAAQIALRVVRDWLESQEKIGTLENIERIVFCLFMKVDITLYKSLLPVYFPLNEFVPNNTNNSSSVLNPNDEPLSKLEKNYNFSSLDEKLVNITQIDFEEVKFPEIPTTDPDEEDDKKLLDENFTNLDKSNILNIENIENVNYKDFKANMNDDINLGINDNKDFVIGMNDDNVEMVNKSDAKDKTMNQDDDKYVVINIRNDINNGINVQNNKVELININNDEDGELKNDDDLLLDIDNDKLKINMVNK